MREDVQNARREDRAKKSGDVNENLYSSGHPITNALLALLLWTTPRALPRNDRAALVSAHSRTARGRLRNVLARERHKARSRPSRNAAIKANLGSSITR